MSPDYIQKNSAVEHVRSESTNTMIPPSIQNSDILLRPQRKASATAIMRTLKKGRICILTLTLTLTLLL